MQGFRVCVCGVHDAEVGNGHARNVRVCEDASVRLCWFSLLCVFRNFLKSCQWGSLKHQLQTCLVALPDPAVGLLKINTW